MARRSKLWVVVASVYTFINVAGAGYAIAMGEPGHLAVHVVLLLVGGVYVARRRGPRDEAAGAQQADERIAQLQQSVDAIALDVERIGEAQRYIGKLAAERAQPAPVRRPDDNA